MGVMIDWLLHWQSCKHVYFCHYSLVDLKFILKKYTILKPNLKFSELHCLNKI